MIEPMKHERPPVLGEEGYGLYKYFIDQENEAREIQSDKDVVLEVLRMAGSLNAVNAFNRLMEKLS